MKHEVPLTLEGASILHQMFRIRWQPWKGLAEERRREVLEEAAHTFTGMEKAQSALFSLLGHKGDLMLVHAVTNLALSVYVIATGRWLFWM